MSVRFSDSHTFDLIFRFVFLFPILFSYRFFFILIFLIFRSNLLISVFSFFTYRFSDFLYCFRIFDIFILFFEFIIGVYWIPPALQFLFRSSFITTAFSLLVGSRIHQSFDILYLAFSFAFSSLFSFDFSVLLYFFSFLRYSFIAIYIFSFLPYNYYSAAICRSCLPSYFFISIRISFCFYRRSFFCSDRSVSIFPILDFGSPVFT